MSLPDRSKLKSIYRAVKKDSSLGLPTDDWFWSSEEYSDSYAYGVGFGGGGGYMDSDDKRFGYGDVLCVGD